MADDKGKKGFAGLDSMVSDVEVPKPRPAPAPAPEPVRQATSLAEAPPDASSPELTESHTTNSSSTNPVPPPQKSGVGSKWLWIVGGIIGLVVLTNHSSNEQQAPTQSTSVQASTPTPEPPRNVEEMPPAGSGLTLSSNQIRYCVAENIRMEAMKTAVNDYSSTEVDTFNQVVADYNSRCSNYRYRRGALQSVTNDVEKNRYDLLNDGTQRILRLRQPSGRPSVAIQQPSAVAPSANYYSPPAPSAAEVKAQKARMRCNERLHKELTACSQNIPDGPVSLAGVGACARDVRERYHCD